MSVGNRFARARILSESIPLRDVLPVEQSVRAAFNLPAQHADTAVFAEPVVQIENNIEQFTDDKSSMNVDDVLSGDSNVKDNVQSQNVSAFETLSKLQVMNIHFSSCFLQFFFKKNKTISIANRNTPYTIIKQYRYC